MTGRAVMPESSVSPTTHKAPSSSPITQANEETAMIFQGFVGNLSKGRTISGYATSVVMAPILTMLQPNAISPPSANARHWMTNTEANVRNAAHGPNREASSTPPTMWPLDPVPGIEKFTICAANTNAPITPIMAGFTLSGFFLI